MHQEQNCIALWIFTIKHNKDKQLIRLTLESAEQLKALLPNKMSSMKNDTPLL